MTCLRSSTPALALLCGAALFAGCSTSTVKTTMRKPAQINMAGYEQITIGRIDYPAAADTHARAMREQLQQRINETGLYQVYDRDNMAEGIKEAELAQYGSLFESQGGGRKFQVANALVTGAVLGHKFSETVETNQWQDQNGVTYTQYRPVGVGNATVSLKVIDLETLEVVAPATMEGRSQVQGQWQDSRPFGLDPDPIMTTCYNQVVDEFMKKLAPYEVPIEVQLCKVGPGNLNTAARRYFVAGEYPQALEQFQAIIEQLKYNPKISPGKLAKAQYNAAVAAEFAGDYDLASELYDESLKNHVNQRTLAGKGRLKERLVDKSKFEDQGIQ